MLWRTAAPARTLGFVRPLPIEIRARAIMSDALIAEDRVDLLALAAKTMRRVLADEWARRRKTLAAPFHPA